MNNAKAYRLFTLRRYQQCLDLLCDDAFSHSIRGHIFKAQGKFNEALAEYQAAYQLDNNSETLEDIGRMLIFLGRYKSALGLLSEGLGLGMALICAQQYDEAIDCLKKLKHDEVVYRVLGRLYAHPNRHEDAMSLYMSAVSQYPHNSDFLSALGHLYLRQGKEERAFQLFAKAILEGPHDSAVYGMNYIIQAYGEYDIALYKYRNAPTSRAHLWNNLGICFFGIENYVSATACLKRAQYLMLDWKILFNLGLVYLRCGQLASAFQCVQSAINIKPTQAAFRWLGVVLSELDDYENACLAWERALQLDPEDLICITNYALSSFNNNQQQKAMKYYKQATEIVARDKTDPLCESALSTLKLQLSL